MSGDLTWPPFVRAGQSTLRTVLDGLETSQWWAADELRAGQARQLEWLLRWAVKSVPWYGKADWPRATLTAITADRERFWEHWQTVPLLAKTELRAHGPALNARSLAAAHLPTQLIRTSGSTGIPVEIRTSSLSRLLWDALTIREHLWHRRDFSKRFGVIRFRHYGERGVDGQTGPSWGVPVATLYATGPASVIHIGLPIATLARWLTRFNPHYLLTYPSVGGALLELMGVAGKPPALEEIRFLSEPLDVELEQRLVADWGVKVTDMYSANEVGYMAFRCPEAGRLHVQSESVLVEILNEHGAGCAVGETGRVVVTGLHNLATPLLRYDIGDYATVGAPCTCGRGLPVIEKVLGRVRNLVRTPDQRSYWPSALGGVRVVPAVRQAQYVQTALDTIELRLVLDRPLTPAETQLAADKVRKLLGYPFKVDVRPVDGIPRGPTGKFEEFLSLLPD